MSAPSQEDILVKVLRSNRSIKEVLICDKVGLVISKVLRIAPIEGIGALESSIFRTAQEICDFLDLGKEVFNVVLLFERYLLRRGFCLMIFCFAWKCLLIIFLSEY